MENSWTIGSINTSYLPDIVSPQWDAAGPTRLLGGAWLLLPVLLHDKFNRGT